MLKNTKLSQIFLFKYRRFQWIIISLLLVRFFSNSMAQDRFNVELLGEVHPFVQQCFDVAISGDYAYIASGMASGLRVLDISNRTAPVETGCCINSDVSPDVANWMADRICVNGDYVYLLYFDGTWSFAHYRLYIYDVSNPDSPQQLGFISLPDNCTSLFAEGNYVYISTFEMAGFSGIKVIDVSNPMDPGEVGSFETPGMPNSVFVTDSTAYIADNNSLVIYDVTDPASPKELSSYIPDGEMVLVHHVAVHGDIIYIIDSLFGVRILDGSDLTSIQEIGSFPHHQTSAHFSPIKISDEVIYYLQDGDDSCKKLVILDVSVPSIPVEIGSYDLSGSWWFYGFDSRDGYGYIAAGSDGLKVVDISNPTSTEEVGYYHPHNLTFGLAVSGNYAYISTVSDSNNLLIYDVSDPSSPIEIHCLSFEGRPFWISSCDNYLYVPGVESGTNSGISVLDISDPANPEEIAYWPCPEGCMGVPLSVERYNDYAFVAMAYGGVQIYDVSQINQPIALDNWTLWNPAMNQGFAVRNVKVSWPYLFVPDEAYGLHVLDISNPNEIVKVANCPTPGSAWWVDISTDKHFLYLADFHGGLRIFDITNPLSPIESGFIQEGLEMTNHVVVSGDTVYLSDSHEIGLHVFDVSNPSQPRKVGYHKTPGVYGLDIAFENGLVYFLDMTHFEIFEIISESPVKQGNQSVSVASDYRIHPIYPNPFNNTARILFDLPRSGHVRLDVYNMYGQKVQTLVNGPYTAGRYTHVFQAENLVSGTYIIRLEINGYIHSRRVILAK